jgi:ubiquinone/menaquinone biosynthesis C-methylase UbiE
VLTDAQLMFLPGVDANHPHFKEWKIRKHSSQRLIAYLAEKNKPLKILEIGCGNGWLSSNLSAIKNSKVTGIDINEVEIMQAKRVFKKNNLEFILASFGPELFLNREFDVILFAASIQYFHSVKNILQSTLSCLSKNGEIHIMDTNFYKPAEISDAAQRTAAYYTSMGYPEMAAYYFHHQLNDLRPFNYNVMFNPHSLLNKFTTKDPFYWIIVKH